MFGKHLAHLRGNIDRSESEAWFTVVLIDKFASSQCMEMHRDKDKKQNLRLCLLEGTEMEQLV